MTPCNYFFYLNILFDFEVFYLPILLKCSRWVHWKLQNIPLCYRTLLEDTFRAGTVWAHTTFLKLPGRWSANLVFQAHGVFSRAEHILPFGYSTARPRFCRRGFERCSLPHTLSCGLHFRVSCIMRPRQPVGPFCVHKYSTFTSHLKTAESGILTAFSEPWLWVFCMVFVSACQWLSHCMPQTYLFHARWDV